MRIRTIIGIVLVVTAVLGFTACGGGEEEPAPTATATATATVAPTATTPADDGGSSGNGAMGEVVSVVLGENPYDFTPATLTFDVGTTYTLSFNAPREFHTFTVEELGINIFINAGEALEETFTPSTVGEFTIVCVPHEGLGMVGTITIQ